MMKSPNDTAVSCAICHERLMMPPPGADAGLCPNLQCLHPGAWAPQRVRDFAAIARLVFLGQKTVVEVEDATGGIVWLAQVPLKPPRPAIVAIDDDGFVRVRDTASPHGQTIRPGVDTLIGYDPRLDKYRIEVCDDGE
jgi:hypothetical protein